MAYATTTQLNTEINARKLADTAEGSARQSADTALAARISALEAAVKALQPAAPTTARPFPAPVTTQTVTVPSTIDATGATDVQVPLNAWLATVPDGSMVVFPTGAVYQISRSVTLWNRNSLVLAGNGATLRLTGSGNSSWSCAFNLNAASHITIQGFTAVGNNPNTTTLYTPGYENQCLLVATASSFIEVAGNTASALYGDLVELYSQNMAPYAPSDGVWVHDNTATGIGRNAVSVIAGTHVLVERNSLDRIGYCVLDVEPDNASDLNAWITFRDNTVGVYGLASGLSGFLLAADGAAGSVVHDITVSGNTVAGNPVGGDGTPRGLNTRVTTARRQNITVTGNAAKTAAVGPVLYFANVDGVTVSGNTQALVSGSLVGTSNCTAVSVS